MSDVRLGTVVVGNHVHLQSVVEGGYSHVSKFVNKRAWPICIERDHDTARSIHVLGGFVCRHARDLQLALTVFSIVMTLWPPNPENLRTGYLRRVGKGHSSSRARAPRVEHTTQ